MEAKEQDMDLRKFKEVESRALGCHLCEKGSKRFPGCLARRCDEFEVMPTIAGRCAECYRGVGAPVVQPRAGGR